MTIPEMVQIDDGTRVDHFYLSPQDDCYYFLEFVKGAGYGPTGNSFINNLKKAPSKRGTWEWSHKLAAIDSAAKAILRDVPRRWRERSTFVPIPPSKARGHVEYDDRMWQVLQRLGTDIDARELVIQRQSMNATHVSENRHSIEMLVQNYEIDESKAFPIPTHLVILDDMVTAGSHFRAISRVLEARFPGVPISGVFLARRVFPNENV
jgi:hypothetical protein